MVDEVQNDPEVNIKYLIIGQVVLNKIGYIKFTFPNFDYINKTNKLFNMF